MIRDIINVRSRGHGMAGRTGSIHPRSHDETVRAAVLDRIRHDIISLKGLNFSSVAKDHGIARQTVARWWREAGEK